MTFEDMWKSLEEKDTTGKYKQAREMAELNVEQLEYAYNSGYADAKSKYERPQGEWIVLVDEDNIQTLKCSICGRMVDIANHEFDKFPYCHCGAKLKGGAE